MRGVLGGVLVSVVVVLPLGCSFGGGSEPSSDRPQAQASDEGFEALQRLHRPLRIPGVEAGARCPRTGGGRPDPRIAVALGDGPAYPVMGMAAPPPSPAGVADLSDDLRRNGWYLHKTLWAVSRRYSGPILIRGRQVDGSRPVRFAINGATALGELSFSAERRPHWRFGVSDTLLRSPGCYAFQLDGSTFSYVIVFEAVRNGKSR
jgi:hypothetical protein